MDYFLEELERLDNKISDTERALKHLNRQIREASAKLSDLTKKREQVSQEHKKSLDIVGETLCQNSKHL